MTGYRFAVLGDPIEHSRSPELHTAMFRITGLNGDYQRILANHEVLKRSIDQMRSGGWDGLNVTMPLKEDAASLSDDLDPLAARAGSVNTLVRTGAEVVGHSTDCLTFRDLLANRFNGVGSVLVLGSGGSAAAALSSVYEHTQVYLAARNGTKADVLAERLGGSVLRWGTAVAGALVINATPLGVAGGDVPEEVLGVASALIDLPYGSHPTSSTRFANENGIDLVDGHEFLMRQAIASFALWTGVEVTLEELVAALRKD
jgi:shikimate dehydrogenase